MSLENRIIVLSNEKAMLFVPDKPTIAIRIFDTNPPYDLKNEASYPLQKSPFFIKPILKYSFDDLSYYDLTNARQDEEDQVNYFVFNKETAEQIITEFGDLIKKNPKADIMVHCYKGRSRSPSIAMALNEIYGLKVAGLFDKYPVFNLLVHDTMLKEARKMGLIN
jgi:hypothetical protein